MLGWYANKLTVAGAPGEVARFVAANRGRDEHYGEEIVAGAIPLSLAAAVPYPGGWRKDREFRPRQWCITHWGVETDLGYHQALIYDARAWEATYEFTAPDGAPVAWLAAVAAHYPTLRFALSWVRSPDGQGGTKHYRRGNETDAVGFHRIVGLPSRVPEETLGAVAF